MNVLPELQVPESGAWRCTEQEAKPYSYTCFLPAHLPWIAHHPLYTDLRGLGGKGLLQVSTPTSHLERERHKASKWVSREVNVKHRILWVTNAGCHWGCPCLFTCRQESFEMCWSSTQSRVQQELGQRSVQILKEMAAQAEENTLPAAQLAHLDKSVYLEIGCLLCGHGKGCCGHPLVQISPTVKLSCAALSKQKAEMSICGFIPVCLYPSVLQRQGWE